MSRIARRLFLHVSALTDIEYDVYSAALRDVMDLDESSVPFNEDVVDQVLGLREVRAWMKGRYHDVAHVDKILKLFCPEMKAQDKITGGQFFAALRLILHSRSGYEITEDKIFIQPSSSIFTNSEVKKMSHMETPSRDSIEAPSSLQPRSRTVSLSPGHKLAGYTMVGNLPDENDIHKPNEAGSASDRTVIPGPSMPMPSGATVKSSHNPFLRRSRTTTGGHADQVTNSLGPSETKSAGRLPPLPPRKPQSMSLGSSLQPSNTTLLKALPTNTANQKAQNPYIKDKPPPPPHPVATSALMKQSLQASKAGQNLKKAQEQLEKERVLEVIRSSSMSPNGSGVHNERTRSISPSKIVVHPLRRPVPSPPRSVTDTIGSIDQVASATLDATRSHSPGGVSVASSSSQKSATRPTSDIPAAPPTHPKRRSLLTQSTLAEQQDEFPFHEGNSGSSPRVSRSISMRAVSGSKPTPPPPRRRPEHIHVSQNFDADKSHPYPSSSDPQKSFMSSDISRPPVHSSLSHSHGHTQSLYHITTSSDTRAPERSDPPLFISGLQHAFSQLQAKTQPALDRARIKAEAGLAPRRGFIFHGSGSAIRADEGEAKLVGGTNLDDLEVDSEAERSSSDEDRLQTMGKGQILQPDNIDRDNLKLPVGDGWAPL